jgi:hypothetical protein
MVHNGAFQYLALNLNLLHLELQFEGKQSIEKGSKKNIQEFSTIRKAENSDNL